MSDGKDKTKESIDQGSLKGEQATERVAEKIEGGADEKNLETGDATGRVKHAVQTGVDSATKAADAVAGKVRISLPAPAITARKQWLGFRKVPSRLRVWHGKATAMPMPQCEPIPVRRLHWHSGPELESVSCSDWPCGQAEINGRSRGEPWEFC